MNRKSWHIFIARVIALAIIFLIMRFQYMTGFLLGSLVSVLAYKNTERYVDQTMQIKTPAPSSFPLNFAMWAGVLILCAVLEEYLSILPCALGLFMVRITLVVQEWLSH